LFIPVPRQSQCRLRNTPEEELQVLKPCKPVKAKKSIEFFFQGKVEVTMNGYLVAISKYWKISKICLKDIPGLRLNLFLSHEAAGSFATLS